MSRLSPFSGFKHGVNIKDISPPFSCIDLIRAIKETNNDKDKIIILCDVFQKIENCKNQNYKDELFNKLSQQVITPLVQEGNILSLMMCNTNCIDNQDRIMAQMIKMVRDAIMNKIFNDHPSIL